MLEPAGERRSSHRFERLYRVTADELLLPRRPEDPRTRALGHKAIDAILRLAGRELKAALDDPGAADDGPRRTLYGRRHQARLPARALRELNRHLAAIEEVFAAATRRRPRAERTVAVTVVMSPVPAGRRD